MNKVFFILVMLGNAQFDILATNDVNDNDYSSELNNTFWRNYNTPPKCIQVEYPKPVRVYCLESDDSDFSEDELSSEYELAVEGLEGFYVKSTPETPDSVNVYSDYRYNDVRHIIESGQYTTLLEQELFKVFKGWSYIERDVVYQVKGDVEEVKKSILKYMQKGELKCYKIFDLIYNILNCEQFNTQGEDLPQTVNVNFYIPKDFMYGYRIEFTKRDWTWYDFDEI